MKTAIMNRENDVTSTAPKKAGIKKGPSPFEVEYLRELKEELEIFLKSRNFTTIQEVQVAFAGSDYTGLMQVRGRHARRKLPIVILPRRFSKSFNPCSALFLVFMLMRLGYFYRLHFAIRTLPT